MMKLETLKKKKLLMNVMKWAGSRMGKSEHDRSRKKVTSKCTTRHIKPTVCATVGSLHSIVQLHYNLFLPNELHPKLRGIL